MKIVKIIPKSQRAKNRVKEHGSQMEILIDKPQGITVRSLEMTFKHQTGDYGKWIGTFTKEEADWEEV